MKIDLMDIKVGSLIVKQEFSNIRISPKSIILEANIPTRLTFEIFYILVHFVSVKKPKEYKNVIGKPLKIDVKAIVKKRPRSKNQIVFIFLRV